MPNHDLMPRDEVAALLGIDPEAVRSTLRRYGITEQRGYPRQQVMALQRPGQGARTDLVTDTLGARIKQARYNVGLSQKELSERLGVPRRTIVAWEHGTLIPGDDVIPALNETLRIQLR